MWLLVVSFCHLLKIPAELILLKGGVLVRWSTCLLYILFFSFSHSEVDILLQTQCLSLNTDAKIYISAVGSQNEIEQPLPRAQVEVCMHAPISHS